MIVVSPKQYDDLIEWYRSRGFEVPERHVPEFVADMLLEVGRAMTEELAARDRLSDGD